MANYFTYEINKIGKVTIAEDSGAITAVKFGQPTMTGENKPSALTDKVRDRLNAFLSGEEKDFSDIPLNPSGTEFQQKVWDALKDIPYGTTTTYADIAIKVGSPKACRAVGNANNKNPIAILVPCHRVVGASGRLVGYAGGLGIKEILLQAEGKN